MVYGRNSYKSVLSSQSSIRAFIHVTDTSTDGLWMMTWCCIRQLVMSNHSRLIASAPAILT